MFMFDFFWVIDLVKVFKLSDGIIKKFLGDFLLFCDRFDWDVLGVMVICVGLGSGLLVGVFWWLVFEK